MIKVEDDSKFYCKYCDKALACGRSQIIDHEATAKHQRSREVFEKVTSYGLNVNYSSHLIANSCDAVASTSSMPDTFTFTEKVQEAEIRITTFFLEHNISFNIASELVGLFQDIDPAVLSKVTLGRSKLSFVANNVVSAAETDRLTHTLREQPFSVYEDEVSDNTLEKWLSLMVRYVEPTTLQIRVELLQHINVDASDCSAPHIFKAFENALCDKKIPVTNVIGMSCDHASVMVGKSQSFKTHLMRKSPRAIVIPCVAHSSATIAKYACAEIPDVDDLVKSIPAFHNASPKRFAIYKKIVSELGGSGTKIPSHSDTRWLARHHCISAIVEKWDVILQYLMVLASEKTEKADVLLKTMQNPLTYAYFLFLKFTLNMFNVYNATFQKRETMVQELQPTAVKFFVWILEKFLKQGLLQPAELFFQIIRKVNFSDPLNQKPLTDLDVGIETRKYLEQQIAVQNLSDEQVDTFYRNCLKFYIVASNQIRERLPFDDLFLSCVACFRPQTAFHADRETSFPRIWKAALQLGSFDEITLKKEWQTLLELSSEEKDKWSNLSFDEMWSGIGVSSSFNGEQRFPQLTSLVNLIRTLPHSNAEAERSFSMISDSKTSKRNRLGNSTLNSICVTRAALKARNETARTTRITRKHLELMNSDNLYRSSGSASWSRELTLFPWVEEDIF